MRHICLSARIQSTKTTRSTKMTHTNQSIHQFQRNFVSSKQRAWYSFHLRYSRRLFLELLPFQHSREICTWIEWIRTISSNLSECVILLSLLNASVCIKFACFGISKWINYGSITVQSLMHRSISHLRDICFYTKTIQNAVQNAYRSLLIIYMVCKSVIFVQLRVVIAAFFRWMFDIASI